MKKLNPKAHLYFPLWAKRMAETPGNRFKQLLNITTEKIDGREQELDLNYPPFCVIGELHGWEEPDDCAYCGEMSMEIYEDVKDGRSSQRVVKDIDELIAHVEKEHPEIVVKAMGKADGQ